MKEPFERLQEARKKAGYEDATEAARAFGWTPVTYLAHENGGRGIRPHVADRYARAFRVPPEWILYGKGKSSGPVAPPKTVPIIGYVSAGEAHLTGEQARHDEVPAPWGSTADTVAVEIRGDSLGPFFDGGIAFYDNVHRPVASELIGKLCVVGLEDGRVLIKKLQRSRTRGLFHLLSQTEAPILDVAVEWAARVKNVVPR